MVFLHEDRGFSPRLLFEQYIRIENRQEYSNRWHKQALGHNPTLNNSCVHLYQSPTVNEASQNKFYYRLVGIEWQGHTILLDLLKLI